MPHWLSDSRPNRKRLTTGRRCARPLRRERSSQPGGRPSRVHREHAPAGSSARRCSSHTLFEPSGWRAQPPFAMNRAGVDRRLVAREAAHVPRWLSRALVGAPRATGGACPRPATTSATADGRLVALVRRKGTSETIHRRPPVPAPPSLGRRRQRERQRGVLRRGAPTSPRPCGGQRR